jgi:uncharacterized RDD family membrane protein YckC
MNVFALDAIVPAIGIVGLTAVVLLMSATPVASALARLRARRLPGALRERLSEEWLAEIHQLQSRSVKLSFAFGLFLARNRAFEVDEPAPLIASLPAWERTAYADRGDRVIAYVIDQVVLIVTALPLLLLPAAGPVGRFLVVATFNALQYAIVYVYCVFRFGGSPGKMLMKLQVVPREGETLTLRHAVLRASPLIAYLAVVDIIQLMSLVTIGSETLAVASPAELRRLTADVIPPVILSGLSITFCIYGTLDLCAFLFTRPVRSFRDIIAGTVVTLKAPATIEVPAHLPPVRSTSMFR